ncbi:RagB/SusD family nutrient uptake outer membrane protein [Flavitalea sp. BT771]|uniref:RagB/SusD family nutrient uptake outer membrane protein n=1 Tax=Flavitalea sp. BT771 TaxID=3063329 RepID=UPI0026E215D9|nr:RagB/SusD family nutrient uptake outer membrane protein [Flavitalea sp. BT771]MDO6430437.1 RagB/SusD family nutrient uptake outer membrane protein [Flavitalea sp. BT771]MDV6219423.1 RagB/SusD family nutrient uptake outer membrane protein [Flavitalea sp. BT771]
MKINHKIWFILVLAASFAGSCKKQLNVFPTTKEVDGNIITDEKSATTALNGVYYRFADAGVDYNGVPVTQWYSGNEETPSQLSGLFDYSNGGPLLSAHTYDAKTYGIDFKWNYGYALVNAANGFLKNIEPLTKITSSAKTRMIAEAKFLRAYGNSELLLYYGQYDDTTSPYGIILHNEFIQPDNIFLPRSTVGAAYDAILGDLDAAIPDLPGTNTIMAYTNSWAAKLLKARVLINRGLPADYTTVINLTKDIIAHSPFQLETNVRDIFWSKGLTSTEVMLGVQPYPNQTAKWLSYINYDDFGPNDFMKSLFENDPRDEWYIQTVITPYGPYTGLTKYYPGSVDHIAAAPVSEYSYAFRLTEAYLLQAEAIVAAGGDLTDARILLKTVMTHAGFTDLSSVDAAASAEQLQLLIIEEEMKSFAAENGQDWLAVRRLPFATLQGLLPSITDKHLLLLPIPDAEIISNDKIKQNPNY